VYTCFSAPTRDSRLARVPNLAQGCRRGRCCESAAIWGQRLWRLVCPEGQPVIHSETLASQSTPTGRMSLVERGIGCKVDDGADGS
jgi:hypothetical protein